MYGGGSSENFEEYDVAISGQIDLSFNSDADFLNVLQPVKMIEIPKTDHICQNDEEKNKEKISNAPQNEKTKGQRQEQKRVFHKIEISIEKVVTAYNIKERNQNETKNLDKIFKTQALYFLRMMKNFKIISQEEWLRVEEMKEKNWSLSFFQSFFSTLAITQKLIEYFESSSFIKRLFEERKIEFKRKLQVMRYLKVLINILKNPSEEPKWKIK